MCHSAACRISYASPHCDTVLGWWLPPRVGLSIRFCFSSGMCGPFLCDCWCCSCRLDLLLVLIFGSFSRRLCLLVLFGLVCMFLYLIEYLRKAFFPFDLIGLPGNYGMKNVEMDHSHRSGLNYDFKGNEETGLERTRYLSNKCRE